MTDRSTKNFETLYRNGSAIETSYRAIREEATTTTNRGFGLYSSLWAFCSESLAGRALDGRRPPSRRGGQELPTNSRSNWFVAGSDHLSTERNRGGFSLVYRRKTAIFDRYRATGDQKTFISTKCANRAAERRHL